MGIPISLNSRFAFVDTETTGLSIVRDRVIEIGILIVENGHLITKYTTLINPEMRLPEQILRFTGITEEELENAPTFLHVKNDILDLLEGALFVAHNARFDYGFLKSEFKRLDLNFKAKTICSVQFSKKLFPEFRAHNLDEVIARCGIKIERRHRALDDAKAIWDFFQHVEKVHAREKVEDALQKMVSMVRVPPKLDEKIIKNMPEAPGVYSFYGKEGQPLYIGKSINLKERVHQHFTQSLSSSRELQIFNRVEHIEVHRTAGELGALLLESKMIKEQQPFYNRMLRRLRKLSVLKKVLDEKGYFRLELEITSDLSNIPAKNIMGIFRSMGKAEDYLIELCDEFNLCRKLVGLDKSKNECFLYQLERCKGACTGKEIPVLYNVRYVTAFEKTRLKRWPFNAPILIEESEKGGDRQDIFVVDQWCIIGTGTYANEECLLEPAPMHFDFDIYKILARRLLKKKLKMRALKKEELQQLRKSEK